MKHQQNHASPQPAPKHSVWLFEVHGRNVSVPFLHNAGCSDREALARGFELNPWTVPHYITDCSVTQLADDKSKQDAMLIYDETPRQDVNLGYTGYKAEVLTRSLYPNIAKGEVAA